MNYSTHRIVRQIMSSGAKRQWIRCVPALVLGPVCFSALPALSQEQPAAATAQAQSAEYVVPPGGLQEVTVTATRRAESASRVPVSITAYTQAQMDSRGLKQIDDLVRFTPGLNLNQTGNGGNDISIRGIASSVGAGTTGIYIDDTPIQVRNIGFNAGTTFPALFDLQRVEVLRGPQGTLFGAGSEGGTVRFIQTEPDLYKSSSYARAELGNTEYGAPSYESGVAFGAPIVAGHLAFRASIFYRRDGGYIDGVTGTVTTIAPGGNLYGNSIQYDIAGTPRRNMNWTSAEGARLALEYKPNDVLTLIPSITYQSQHVNDGNDSFWLATSNPAAGVFTRPVYDAGDPVADPALTALAAPNTDEGNDRFYLPAVRANVNLGPVELVSNTSYFDRGEHQWYDFTNFYQWLYSITPAPGEKAASLYSNSQRNFVEEIRLQSSDPDARVSWVAGLFYSHDRQVAEQAIGENFLTNAPVIEVVGLPPSLAGLAGGAPFGPGSSAALNYFGVPLLPNSVSWTADIGTLDRQEAAFAQANFQLTKRWKLTAGVRVSRDELFVDGTYGGPENNNNYAYGIGCPAGLNAAATACVASYPVTNDSRSETATTPKAGVEFQVNQGNMLYATAAKGFRPPGANLLVPVSQCGQDLENVGYVNPSIPLAAVTQGDSKEPAVFGSDWVWSYEVGSKSRIAGGRALIDASIYRINWYNIQSLVDLPLCAYNFADNAGKAASQGFDIGIQGAPVSGLLLSATFGYNKTTFVENAQTPNGTVLFSKDSGVPGVGAPMTFSLSGQYDFTALDGRAFYARADLTHSSTLRAAGPTSPTSSTYQPLDISQHAFSQLNVRLGSFVFEDINLSLFVNNVTNSHPDLGLTYGGPQGGYPAVWTDTTLRPRTYGLTMIYRH